MKLLKQTLLVLTLSTLVFSCSDDDPATLDVSDAVITVDENQAEDTVLGSVIATGSDGTFAYSIASQSPTGAIAIDAITGEITVADASTFDFETNPIITVNVDVMGSSITETAQVTITLDDIDDIEFLLSASKANYIAASNGDWVEISEIEYDNLFSNLNETKKVGLNDVDFINDHTTLSNGFSGYSMINHSNGIVLIPNDAYSIAFKYVSKTSTVARTEDQVKISSSSSLTDGFANLGGKLPSHTGEGEHFFVIKNNTTKNSAEGYLAFYSSNSMGYQLNSFSIQYSQGNTDTLIYPYSGACYYQGIATTQKQW